MGYNPRNTRDSNRYNYHFSNTHPYDFPDIPLNQQDLTVMCKSPHLIASRVLLSLHGIVLKVEFHNYYIREVT